MIKITLTITALLFSLFGNAQITSAAPYCTPVYPTNSTYNMIQDFKIGGTIVQSFGAMGVYHNIVNTFLYYNTTTLPTLIKGSGYSFTLDFFNVNDVEPNYFAVWIDFNQNNTFENSEIVMQNNNTINTDLPTYGGGVTPVSKTITIPTTAISGVTRMRIKRATNDSNVYGAYSSTFVLPSCSSTSNAAYGCIYDFNVTIGSSLSNTTFENESIKIFPNPVTNTLFVTDLNNSFLPDVIIRNQLGQVVKTSNLKLESGINVSMLNNGVYFIQMLDKNNSETHTIKFIKN